MLQSVFSFCPRRLLNINRTTSKHNGGADTDFPSPRGQGRKRLTCITVILTLCYNRMSLCVENVFLVSSLFNCCLSPACALHSSEAETCVSHIAVPLTLWGFWTMLYIYQSDSLKYYLLNLEYIERKRIFLREAAICEMFDLRPSNLIFFIDSFLCFLGTVTWMRCCLKLQKVISLGRC